MALLKSRTKASALTQKYIAIGRKKEGKDSEKLLADTTHMIRAEDHSEVDPTSDTESDIDQENEVLSFLIISQLK